MNTPKPQGSTARIVLGSRAGNPLTRAILLEEAISPRFARLTILLVFITLASFIAWAALAKLDIVSTALGQIAPSSAVQVIQHVDGGRIAQINVVEGQRVHKVEELMRLNDSEAAADLDALTARSNKLRSEVAYLHEVASIRVDLAKDQLNTRTQALDAQRALAQQQGELDSVQHQIVKLKEKLQRTRILAPMDGVVQDLKFRTLGGVIPVAATIMNIVPDHDVLRAEVRIATTDVGHVRPDQPVRIKVGTYDFLRYGVLEGKVELVSANSSMDDKGQPYFKGYVALSRAAMGKFSGSLPVMAGMTVQCDIITDRQTVLRYLLRPIYLAFSEGMRER
jgi:multidrug efflux pump subunit AcrA (membrane-fusion protein)